MNISEKNLLNLKGKIEIFDKNGDLYFSTTNLVLTVFRASILQILFNDNKISDTINNKEGEENELITRIPNNNYKKLICGFALGEGGANLNVSATTIKVPTHKDSFTNNTFKKIPFISITESGENILINNNNSYENLNEIINNSSDLNNPSTKIDGNGNISTLDNGNPSGIKYFYKDDNNYYCKTFDNTNSKCNYISSTGEIDYVVKLAVDNWDCIGETLSEIGLVMATCQMDSTNSFVIGIDNDSVRLATRATFSPISLATDLLSSFTIKYHIYI